MNEDSRKEIISDEKKIHHVLQLLIKHQVYPSGAGEMKMTVNAESVKKDNMMLSFTVLHALNENDRSSHPCASGSVKEFRLALCESLIEILGGKLNITASAEGNVASFKIPVKLISTESR